ncbi:hypothetical protein EAH72_26660 [Pseudomonas caspiana]|nr:hypothetical protein EAH72_26660 [Pseudomonas caspiana]
MLSFRGRLLGRVRSLFYSGQTPNPVGASLLAMASLHPTWMVTDLPLSRAGSLPQVIDFIFDIGLNK